MIRKSRRARLLRPPLDRPHHPGQRQPALLPRALLPPRADRRHPGPRRTNRRQQHPGLRLRRRTNRLGAQRSQRLRPPPEGRPPLDGRRDPDQVRLTPLPPLEDRPQAPEPTPGNQEGTRAFQEGLPHVEASRLICRTAARYNGAPMAESAMCMMPSAGWMFTTA